MTDQELLELAKDVALQAGKVIMDVYDSGEFTEYSKDDESPVTSADYQANDVIVSRLQAATPDIPILSEESAQPPLAERQQWARYWLIDPIDGTQEFIARSGDFAVNIALIENQQPKIGVIYWPAGDSLYFAMTGYGAFKLTQAGQQAIAVRKFNQPACDVVTLAISRRQNREGVMSRLDADRQYQTLPTGSCSLKACFIAEGKADFFMRLGVTGEWDAGASECIINEAGGKLWDVYFNPLTYNQRETLINPNFIITGDQHVDWQQLVRYRD